MLKKVEAAVRVTVARMIRVLEEALSITIILVMSLAPAAGAIAVGVFVQRRSIPFALLASASLGATVVCAFGLFRKSRNDRSRRKQPNQARAEEPKAAGDSPLEGLTDAMVTFHDFNSQRRRFDHW